MITITAVEEVKTGKVIEHKRSLKLFRSIDKCMKYIAPFVREMKLAESQKRKPSKYIDGVSYDTDYEKRMLIGAGAIRSEEVI